MACFASVFVVTLLLAGRQYFLVREREIESRAHQLELRARTLDTGIHSLKSQLRFLRTSAERLLPAQSGTFDPVADPALKAALAAQRAPLWSLADPGSGAAIRGIGSPQLALLPGLKRDDDRLATDLKLARIMGQLLGVQFQLNPDLAHTAMVTSSGVVVSSPPLTDEQNRSLVELFAASGMFRLAAKNPHAYDVLFDAERGRQRIAGDLLFFAAPVTSEQEVRGAVVFAIPQKTMQERLRQPSRPDDSLALLDAQGVLIASNQATFQVSEGSWLATQPGPWRDLPVSRLFSSRGGLSISREDFLFHRKLDHAALVLVNHIPAATMMASILRQFSVVFLGIWLLLAFLLATTLVIVDRLLARQMDLSEQLRAMAAADPLTGLANRRRLSEEFTRLLQDRRGVPRMSVLMVDIDHFKKVNDAWGHDTGDDVLKHLAALLRRESRDQDVVARFGGEEFCILLPDSYMEEACALAERLRITVAESSCAVRHAGKNEEVRVTVSIGVACSRTDKCRDPEELIAIADRRLYLAKQNGRNRVVGGPRSVGQASH